MKQHSPKTIEKSSSAVSVLPEMDFYLIKLFAHNQEPLFGEIEDGCLVLNGMGQIAADEWLQSASTYSMLKIDEWVVLPNRLEGIVSIQTVDAPGQYDGKTRKPRLLSSFVASYKAAAAKRINLYRNQPGGPIWQRSYQERFIPDEAVLKRVKQMLQKQSSY